MPFVFFKDVLVVRGLSNFWIIHVMLEKIALQLKKGYITQSSYILTKLVNPT
jgi:hypothetical protein